MELIALIMVGGAALAALSFCTTSKERQPVDPVEVDHWYMVEEPVPEACYVKDYQQVQCKEV